MCKTLTLELTPTFLLPPNLSVTLKPDARPCKYRAPPPFWKPFTSLLVPSCLLYVSLNTSEARDIHGHPVWQPFRPRYTGQSVWLGLDRHVVMSDLFYSGSRGERPPEMEHVRARRLARCSGRSISLLGSCAVKYC
jgi:hypothetical protein